MEKYRMKKGAKQFFDSSISERTLELNYWDKMFNIPHQLLEKVDRVKVIYGHSSDYPTESMHTNSWSSSDSKGKIYLTLEISNIGLNEFENIKRSKLMLGLQIVANKFFED